MGGGGADRTNESPFRDRERGTTCVPKVFYYAEKKSEEDSSGHVCFSLLFGANTKREKELFRMAGELFSSRLLSFFFHGSRYNAK